jgi:cytochrome c5
MSEIFTCDDKETLVAYLYGDVDEATRHRVDDHLRRCTACGEEVSGLSGVRVELASWTPPEPALGFTIVRTPQVAAPAEVVRPARWRPAAVPAWAQAVAAVLVLAVGLAIANVQVRYDASGFRVSTGWMSPAASPAAAPAAQNADDWRPALASLADELRREMRRGDVAAVPASGIRASTDGELTTRRVSTLIAQSEERQRQELAKQLIQVGRDFDTQRRADLMRINQVVGRLDGQTGEVARTQRQMLDYIVRVSQPQQ